MTRLKNSLLKAILAREQGFQNTAMTFASSIDYAALGDRLRAYRVGASLQAQDVAAQLGVSRAVVYRMEKGEIVKLETVERLAQLLGTSMASLMGVEVEYYANFLSFFERMRQLEQGADRIIAHFEPISLLLTSGDYLDYLRLMLLETLPQATSASKKTEAVRIREIDQLVQILEERKTAFATRRPGLVSLVGLRDLERFIHTGLVGRLGLPAALHKERIKAARQEIERIADLMEAEPMHVQIGLVDDAMPSATFQLFQNAEHSRLAVSPFRLGELPNVRNGIATVTASPEAVRLYEEMIERLWKGAYKGKSGAERLRKLLAMP